MTVLAAVGEKQHWDPVVATAYDLATAYDDELVVLHVVPNQEFEDHLTTIRSIPEFENYSLGQEEESAASFAKRVVNLTLGEYDGDRVHAVGRVGDPVDEILDAVEGLDPRYLVIGQHPRSPTNKALFGSTAQSLLLNAPVPVVTVME
jgi:nucleotide-binding universal stress UspA family protein